MIELDGRVAIITGGAGGQGAAAARLYAEHGAKVVIADITEAAGKAVAEEIGEAAFFQRLDVGDEESWGECIAATKHRWGRIDALLNNAGVMPVGPFLDHSDQAVRTAVEVNFYGVLTGCRLALPEMVRRRSGHIVNIASMAGMLAVPGQALYAGTKFAVVGLSTGLADEYAPQGVQISCVMPTFTNTELISGTHTTAATKPVQPEDIAAAVVKALDNPTTSISVPGYSRFLAAAVMFLPPRGRRWLSKKMGTDRVFLDFDTSARAAYEKRAQSATGVVEDPQPN